MQSPSSKTSKQTRGFFASFLYAGWAGVSGVPGYLWNAWVNARYGSQVSDGRNEYGQSSMPYGGMVGSAGAIYAGFEKPPPGTFETYRMMRQNPTLVIAQAATFCPILASTWGVEAAKFKAPTGAKDLVERTYVRRRTKLVKRLLAGMHFGFSSLEQVWGIDEEGAVVPLDFKYLIPDITTCVVDDHGNFMGLVNDTQELSDRECLWYTHNREGDNYYGISRFENVRRTWANAMSIEDTGFRLDQKAAGTTPYVGYPLGTSTDSTGKEISNYQAALQLVASVSKGMGVVYPNHGTIAEDDLLHSPDLAKQSLWNWGFMDAGNSGPAQEAILNKLRYYDSLMLRGWCKTERSLIQADTAGSRADSETHQGINDADNEQIHDEITEVVNEQSVTLS